MRRLALAVLLAAALAPRPATAHFVLESPTSWRTQGEYGDPQKTGPCGNEAGAEPTGVVTSFTPGQTITITIDEKIWHPGHYRVALAIDDQSELPASPPVTADDDTDCGTVPIMDPPQFPVLADGMLPHTSAFSEPMSFQVTLPSDVTCTRCTLQVLEFMSDHVAPCFYHHCAEISIQPAAPTDCTEDTACDDGNACTRDRCTADTGCVSEATALSDVGPGFLGSLGVADCATDDVPAAIGTRFQQAQEFVERAAAPGAKAARFLKRARKRLQTATAKVDKAARKRLSTACAAALGDVLDRAEAGVACLAAQR